MSDDTSTQNTGDESVTEENQTSEENQQAEVVPKSELQKALDDLMKFKKQARELEGKIKDREMQELTQKQEWEKIAKIKEQEAQAAIEKANMLESSFLNQKRFDALKSAALAQGIRKEALNDLELIDFNDDVAIETTSTGRINVVGADSAIKKLKAQRPYWFGKSMGAVNTDSPGETTSQAVTLDAVMKAQDKARKTQDWTEYKKVFAAYRQQK